MIVHGLIFMASSRWSKVLHYIAGTDIPQASFAEKMRERDRQMLKDKFLVSHEWIS